MMGGANPLVLADSALGDRPGAAVREGRTYLPLAAIEGAPPRLQVNADGVAYVDVSTFREFQQLHTPQGWYWCEFYGGELEYRCFLVPAQLRRAEFLLDPVYAGLLDESVSPIYDAGGVTVRQDPTHAMPGFYIVAPSKPYFSTDALGLRDYLLMRFVDFEVGVAMRNLLGIRKILRTNEEREVSYQNVHTWLLPIEDVPAGSSIHDFNTLEYMVRFSSWRRHKEQIGEFNRRMRAGLVLRGVARRVEVLRGMLEGFGADAAARDPATTATPVYSYKGVAVIHHEAALPGAYCIAAEAGPAEAGTPAERAIYLRMRLLDYFVRVALRETLGIGHAYKLQEDVGRGPSASAIHILPIVDIMKYNRIYHFVIGDYLREHGGRPGAHRRIEEGDRAVAAFLAGIRMPALDDQLAGILQAFETQAANDGC